MKMVLAGTAAAIAMALTLGVAPVQAQTPVQAHKMVPYADLDLTANDGAAHFDRRLVRAVAQVCDTGSRELRSILDARKCDRATLAQARTAASQLRTVMVAQRAERGHQVGR